MSFKYVVFGSGRQGTAAAFDLGAHGEAAEVVLADADGAAAELAASLVNRMVGRSVARAVELDVSDEAGVARLLESADGCLSAVPYFFNLAITRAAIETATHLTDIGGNTDVVQSQLELDPAAKSAGISVIPDCGMGPGMTGSLAALGVALLDEPLDVFILDGGLPEDPNPPWNYSVTFHINGLTNEYDGTALFIRNWDTVNVPCLTELEVVDFAPLGKLEAAVCAGGTSTAISCYQGKLRTYQNKVLRYPGHWAQFSAYRLLGLFGTEPIEFGAQKTVPRDFYHALLEPKIRAPEGFRDICLIRATVRGIHDRRPKEVVLELIDRYDPVTGFTSMQRLTGWHAAIMLGMAVRGEAKRGVLGLEAAVDPVEFLGYARRRGFRITETWRALESV